jgi:hypothetical protein
MFYMFGGPDFCTANAFLPNATTCVLSGLEPVGPVGHFEIAAGRSFRRSNIGARFRNVLTLSYFITAHAQVRILNAGP